jgi:starch synthase
VVDIARQMSPRPHVIHCHDWQTGLAPAYLARQEALKEELSGTAAVFTVHNIGYQGLFPESDLRLTGLDPSLYNPEGLEFYSRINLLKGGIVFAAAVTTVSHRYAQEIQDPGNGFGLDGVMRKYRDKLFGILNGADYGSWNPETDRHLPANYSARAPEGKALCKKALQAELNLTVDSHIPLVGMVTRLVEQKGIELLLAGLSELLELNIQFVLLGTGAERYQEELQSLARRQPERSAVVLGFDEGLSHRIEAGCDFFLMPSRYEPCGLNQIYSLKYGTVPIVRASAVCGIRVR